MAAPVYLALLASLIIESAVAAPVQPSGNDNHLWFRGFTKANPSIFGDYHCGEVDAGPRMPDDIFDPSNAVALQAYIKTTIALFNACHNDICPLDSQAPFVELGRCAGKNYSYPDPWGNTNVAWAPRHLMQGVCEKQCMCNFNNESKTSTLPICQDTPDDPKAGTFCSLCGPKFNKPMKVTLFECGCNCNPVGNCTCGGGSGPVPGPGAQCPGPDPGHHPFGLASAGPLANPPWIQLAGGDCCPGVTNCSTGNGPYAVSTGGDYPATTGPLCDKTPGCIAFGQMDKFVTHYYFDSAAACTAASEAAAPIAFSFECNGGPTAVPSYRSTRHMVSKQPWSCYTHDNTTVADATPNTTAMSHGVAGINVTIGWSWDWSGFGNCKKESGTTTIVPPTTSTFGTHMANCTDGGYRALTLYCAVGVGGGGGNVASKAGGSGDATVTAHYVTSAGGFNTVEDGPTVSSGCSTVIDGRGQPEPDQGGKCCFA